MLPHTSCQLLLGAILTYTQNSPCEKTSQCPPNYLLFLTHHRHHHHQPFLFLSHLSFAFVIKFIRSFMLLLLLLCFNQKRYTQCVCVCVFMCSDGFLKNERRVNKQQWHLKQVEEISSKFIVNFSMFQIPKCSKICIP